MCDGLGYLLGDEGSGYAVGQGGLASALRHHDGRGGSALLHRLADRKYGDLDGLPSRVHGAANPAHGVAAFASDVRVAAEQGDDQALVIWVEARRALAGCAAGAARALGAEDATVTTTGGLFRAGALLCDSFESELRRLLPRARLVAAVGDAVHGAWLLATHPSFPHEPLVSRFPAATAVAAAAPREDPDLAIGRLETESPVPTWRLSTR